MVKTTQTSVKESGINDVSVEGLGRVLDKRAGAYSEMSNRGEFRNVRTALATYVDFTDPVKLFALNNSYEQALSVFGPYGGVYCEVFQNPQTSDTILSKSKDGHSFFNSLGFVSRILETVLATIREKTLYISGLNGKTSRDGTTSLALISMAVTRDLISKRMVDPEAFKVPTSVTRFTVDIINKVFRDIVDANKLSIYREDTIEYTTNGFKQALSAITTTVDGKPLFVNAFKKLMLECQEKGIDLRESVKVSIPEQSKDEALTFDLRLRNGIRMSAKPANENKASSLDSYKAPLFILDGYIGDMAQVAFEKDFIPWLKSLLDTKDESGFYVFSKYNPKGLNAPVFLFNRTTEKMKVMFDMLANYFRHKLKSPTNNDEIIEEIIVPKFIFLESEDLSKEQYTMFTTIFDKNVIPLNGIRRLIYDTARPDPTTVPEGVPNIPSVGMLNSVELSFLPKLKAVNKQELSSINIQLPVIPYDKGIKEDLANSSTNGFTHKSTNLLDTICDITFDGARVFINPVVDISDEVKVHSNALKDNLSNYSKHTNEYATVKRTLDMFNTASVTPIFTYRTADELKELSDLYQDAQGVFESVHAHGVMSGGNVTLFRYYKELHATVNEEIIGQYSDVSPLAREKYINYANEVLESILTGYFDVYKDLVNKSTEETKYLVELYQTKYKSTSFSRTFIPEDGVTPDIMSYDIVSDTWNSSIIEPTRSTVDIFGSALDVLYDMVTTKRVKINDEKDSLQMQKEFSGDGDFTIHPSTKHLFTVNK